MTLLLIAPTHQMLGLFAGLLALIIYSIFRELPNDPIMIIIYFIAVAIGGAIPDADHPKTKLGRKLVFITSPIRWVFTKRKLVPSMILYGILAFCLVVFLKSDDLEAFGIFGIFLILGFLASKFGLTLEKLRKMFGHRKLTHSLIFYGAITVGVYFGTATFNELLYVMIFSGFLAGVLAHIFGDSLTKRGVPIFYPLSKKNFKAPLTFRTGSKTEAILFVILVAANIVLFTQLLDSF